MASAAALAVRLPLNESGAMTTRMDPTQCSAGRRLVGRDRVQGNPCPGPSSLAVRLVGWHSGGRVHRGSWSVRWLVLAILVGALVGVGSATFDYASGLSYLSNDPEACVNCHIMNDQFDSWRKGPHHAAATCNDCHVPPHFPEKYLAKARNGWHHSVGFTFQPASPDAPGAEAPSSRSPSASSRRTARSCRTTACAATATSSTTSSAAAPGPTTPSAACTATEAVGHGARR